MLMTCVNRLEPVLTVHSFSPPCHARGRLYPLPKIGGEACPPVVAPRPNRTCGEEVMSVKTIM